VLFFPEGTRSTTGEMDSFKKGAFSVAAKEGVPVVPITLVGTGQILTTGAREQPRWPTPMFLPPPGNHYLTQPLLRVFGSVSDVSPECTQRAHGSGRSSG
jgi:1-acyl-sn-glycerol-3-phosphate acyltransferase